MELPNLHRQSHMIIYTPNSPTTILPTMPHLPPTPTHIKTETLHCPDSDFAQKGQLTPHFYLAGIKLQPTAGTPVVQNNTGTTSSCLLIGWCRRNLG